MKDRNYFLVGLAWTGSCTSCRSEKSLDNPQYRTLSVHNATASLLRNFSLMWIRKRYAVREDLPLCPPKLSNGRDAPKWSKFPVGRVIRPQG